MSRGCRSRTSRSSTAAHSRWKRPLTKSPEFPYRPFGSAPQPGSALYLGFDQLPLGAGGAPFPSSLRFRVFRPEGSEQRAGRALRARIGAASAARPHRVGVPTRGRRALAAARCLQRRERRLHTRGLHRDPRPSEDRAHAGREGRPATPLAARRVAGGRYASGQEPEIDFIRANVVPASNLSTVQSELVGASNGRPDQVFRLRRRPVAAHTLELEVDEPYEQQKHWSPKPDFLASRPEDKHYVLNANTGELRFGDGRRGRIPVADADIVAVTYRYGGGGAGNVSADQITTLLTTVSGVESVTNRRPAVGGRDEQEVEDLKLRAPAAIRRHNRAVTADDFASLAEEVGGVARAGALPLRHPDHPGRGCPRDGHCSGGPGLRRPSARPLLRPHPRRLPLPRGIPPSDHRAVRHRADLPGDRGGGACRDPAIRGARRGGARRH